MTGQYWTREERDAFRSGYRYSHGSEAERKEWDRILATVEALEKALRATVYGHHPEEECGGCQAHDLLAALEGKP